MNRKIVGQTAGLLAVFVLAFALITASAHADSTADKVSFTGDIDKIITSDEFAVFELTLHNTNAPNNIELAIEDSQGWTVEFSETELSVSKDADRAFSLNLTPPEHVEAKTYYFELLATSGAEDESLGAVILEVSIGKDTTPIILKDLEIPDKIYPGQTTPFTLKLYNNNYYAESNLKVIISSTALEKSFSVVKSFDGKETKTLTGELAIAPFLDAGKYTITVSCGCDEAYTIHELTVTVPAEGSMVVEEDVDYSFLRSTHTIMITNLANYKLDDTYELDVGGVSRYFTFVSPEADRADGGHYEYDISLAPGESTVIKYSISYVPLIIGLVLLALLVFWVYSRKKCLIHKKVLATKGADGKSLVKVSIAVKNKSYKAIHDLSVTDRVPASLKPVHKASAMRPDIIKQQGTHATMTWKIPKLGPREERIVSYYVTANVRLVGRVSLPPAEVSLKRGKRKDTYISNTALLRAA